MKKSYISIITTLFLFSLSCKHELSNTNIKKPETDYLKNLSKRLDTLSDTSFIDPQKVPDVVTYNLQANSPSVAEQKAFVKSSGFSLAEESRVMNRIKRETVDHVPETFQNADSRYKAFVVEQASNPNLTIFKQNSASLIIRKYLLGDGSQNSSLQYYTEELLQSHSQNYALLYSSIAQLKGFVTERRLNQYKNMIHTDPVVANWKQNNELIIQRLNKKLSSLTQDQLAMINIYMKGTKLASVRSSYFISKIDHL